MIYDEIEEKEEFKKVLPLVEKLTELQLEKKGINSDTPNYIVIYWNVKKSILKENFDIDWKTPEELNPDILFN
ncbi:MAG: hypothetical protein PHU94_00225 [Bacilli bacterium]|nr:hypothetical protein [Bacilli bacterium]MDD4733871.1 hypothetical protein [Bacilli bacterium]